MKKEVRQLLTQVKVGDTKKRARAIQRLGELRAAEGVKVLVALFKETYANAQRRSTTLGILDALEKIGDAKAARELLNLFEEESFPLPIQERILQALEKMYTPQVVFPLDEILAKRERSPSVRCLAASILAKSANPEVLHYLIDFYLDLENPDVRYLKLHMLAELRKGGDRVYQWLLSELENSHEKRRVHAAIFMGDFGDRRGLVVLKAMAGRREGDLSKLAAESTLILHFSP